ncbi:zinc finger protein 84-like [Penaeus monodon]|uniref:zinc finger protein 84-like n=1 Tax=Penaeus monodon TaxID=6687 RepID=UPI0018A78010|nr:zinc finger protein 84-like [Penaeus monodon]XP_037803662.1 zinc finger protein 84-like [Penaeus monodon]
MNAFRNKINPTMDAPILSEISLCTELFTNLELSVSEPVTQHKIRENKNLVKKIDRMPLSLTGTTPVLFSGASYLRRRKHEIVDGSAMFLDRFLRIRGKKDASSPSMCKVKSAFPSLQIECNTSGDTKVCPQPSKSDTKQLQYIADPLRTSAEDTFTVKKSFNQKYDLKDFVQSIESYCLEQDDNQGEIVSNKRTFSSASKKRKQRELAAGSSEIPSFEKDENDSMWHACKKCHYEFSTAKGLANHMKTHPKVMIEKNSCVYCGRSFEDAEALRDHLYAEHIFEVTNYTCESCGVECISADLFDKHQYFCHRTDSASCLLCSNCDKVYYNRDLQAYHKEREKYCSICSITFCMSAEQYKNHKEKHILYKYKCSKCNASFITKASLTKHLETKNQCCPSGKVIKNSSTSRTEYTSDDRDAFEGDECQDDIRSEDSDTAEEKDTISQKNDMLHRCPVCSAAFVRHKNLLSHVGVVHPQHLQDANLQNLVKNYQCTKCDKKFTKKSNLVAHIASHIRSAGSNETGQPKCSVCHKTFRLQRYLVDHMRLHTGRGTHQCKHCDKKFLRLSHLKLHMEMHDNSHKSHSCIHCNKKYMRKQDLMQHIRVKHSSTAGKNDDGGEVVADGGFQCPSCGVLFPTTLKLRMHEVTHQASKPPYKCQECSREFPSLSVLKRHYLIHWNILPFTCTVCSRSFRYSQSLKRHMVTHTGERNYTCIHCGKRFGLKGNLNTHLQQHSAQRVFSCLKCGDSFTSRREQKTHFCSQMAQGKSSDINCTDYTVLKKANDYMEYEPVENCTNDSQDPNAAEALSNFVPNTTLSDMTGVTHLISDNSISDITTVAGLVPNSLTSTSVGHLIAHVPINEAVPSTSFRELHPQAHKTSHPASEILEQPNSPDAYENSTMLEGVPALSGKHEADVLSQAFAVMAEDNIIRECVNLDTCSQLPQDAQDSPGMDSTIYTLVTVDGDNSQPTLINIPSISNAGVEENVTLQINFPESGSEVSIIIG